jgi:EAL domain-containing protein (putative c-di-GMP-specific phosphodiesterase class I)
LRSTAAAIAQAGLQPSDVVFEVTETHKVRNMAHLKGVLSFYRNAGFEVALDDVGAGWSGLNMLNQLMPDYAKIDMELIRDIDTTPSKQRIVKHLIASAKENGIKVIAEGIESQEEAACVAEFGADFLQGFYFAKPELKASIKRP